MSSNHPGEFAIDPLSVDYRQKPDQFQIAFLYVNDMLKL